MAESQEARACDVGPEPAVEIGEVTHDSAQSERTGGTLSTTEDAARPAPELTVATTDHESERPALVDAFLRQVNRDSGIGFRVMKKHIWLAAGHARARQFQYWQEKSNKATESDDRNIRRILRMSPAEFVALLQQKGIVPPNS